MASHAGLGEGPREMPLVSAPLTLAARGAGRTAAPGEACCVAEPRPRTHAWQVLKKCLPNGMGALCFHFPFCNAWSLPDAGERVI